ncbi:MAG TPA: response regulator [Pyrinomonadaceae bacterium]|nr:response regulator [Pyrinomonadaceae bacterium]
MTKPPNGKPTILVVDDFDDIRDALRLVLEGRGYSVVAAQDGRQALHVAKEALPSLILMDLFMPKQDGFAAARAIRAEPELRGVPIVAVSAYGELGIEDELQKKARAAGFNAYVAKPFDARELMTLITELLAEND